MRMFDLNNKLVNVDVRPSTYPLRAISKSTLQGLTAQKLQEKYPQEPILEEFVIPGSRLSVDFFLPRIGLAIEVQGIQHDQHTPFFHGSKTFAVGFAKQKKRDIAKANWIEVNGYTLVEVRTEEDFNQL